MAAVSGTVQEERRERVLELHLKGFTPHRIWQALRQEESFQRVSRRTIKRDLEFWARQQARSLDHSGLEILIRELDAQLLQQIKRSEELIDGILATHREKTITRAGGSGGGGTSSETMRVHEGQPSWTAAVGAQRNILILIERRMRLYGLDTSNIAAQVTHTGQWNTPERWQSIAELGRQLIQEKHMEAICAEAESIADDQDGTEHDPEMTG